MFIQEAFNFYKTAYVFYKKTVGNSKTVKCLNSTTNVAVKTITVFNKTLRGSNTTINVSDGSIFGIAQTINGITKTVVGINNSLNGIVKTAFGNVFFFGRKLTYLTNNVLIINNLHN